MKRYTVLYQLIGFFALVILLIIGGTEVEASESPTYSIIALIGEDMRVINVDALSLHECKMLGNRLHELITEVDEDAQIGCFPRVGNKVTIEKMLLLLRLNELDDK